VLTPAAPSSPRLLNALFRALPSDVVVMAETLVGPAIEGHPMAANSAGRADTR
jgi:hypothetical protein